MVCKRSLYCQKYGPCASDQMRRQIWEDNIKFRQNFKSINQSDHYWSFQVVGTPCCCCEAPRRPTLCRQRYGSLQTLDQIDCVSVTHGREQRIPATPCPLHNPSDRPTDGRRDAATATEASNKNCVDKSVGFCPAQQKHVSMATEVDIPSRYLSKEVPPCPRYKNTVTDSYKGRYCSQPNLNSFPDDSQSVAAPRERSKKVRPGCATVSRTTRRTLLPNKATPFLPFGCNNSTNDMATKKTHNVLAKQEVYPNALSAKEQRQESIRKLLLTEQDFNHTLRTNNFKRKPVNHSSLWVTEYNRSFRDTNSDLLSAPTLQAGGRAQTPIPRPAQQPLRAIRRPSSQAMFY